MKLGFAVIAALGLALCGCGNSDEKVVETPAQAAKAQELASGWTPEMKDAFKAAHNRTKSGADK